MSIKKSAQITVMDDQNLSTAHRWMQQITKTFPDGSGVISQKPYLLRNGNVCGTVYTVTLEAWSRVTGSPMNEIMQSLVDEEPDDAFAVRMLSYLVRRPNLLAEVVHKLATDQAYLEKYSYADTENTEGVLKLVDGNESVMFFTKDGEFEIPFVHRHLFTF